jgi:hypothetical protein
VIEKVRPGSGVPGPVSLVTGQNNPHLTQSPKNFKSRGGMSDEVAMMSLDQVKAAIRAVTGTPWLTERDGAYRQALWLRLDDLVAAAERGRR